MTGSKLIRAISGLLIVALLAGEIGILVLPRRAQAQGAGTSVPIDVKSGRTDSTGTVEFDESKFWQDFLEGAKSVAINTAISYFSRRMEAKLTQQFGIKSYQRYSAALIETKNLVEAYAHSYGNSSVALNTPSVDTSTPAGFCDVGDGFGDGYCTNDPSILCTTDSDCAPATTNPTGTCDADNGFGDLVCSNDPNRFCTTDDECVTGNYPNSVFDLAAESSNDYGGITGGQSNTLGAREANTAISPEIRRQELQKRLVRASSLFASSVICGGLQADTVRNMAEYMAGSTLGFTLQDVNPTAAVDYYEKLSRYGSPEALPEYWVETFRDTARQKEAEAKEAATLEIVSPGTKASQTRDSSGRTKIYKPKSAIEATLRDAIGSMFKLPEAGSKSRFNTTSMSAFLSDAAAQIGTWTGLLIARRLANWPPINVGTQPATMWAKLAALAPSIAGAMANVFVTNIFNKITQMIFQGDVLAESNGCRRLPRRTVFTSGNRTIRPPTGGFPAPPAPPAPILILTLDDETIASGESTILRWDGSSFGAGTTFTIFDGTTSGSVTTVGTRVVSPTVTTTYTLTATGPSGTQTRSITLIVSGVAVSNPSLTLSPQAIGGNRMTKVSWNGGTSPATPTTLSLSTPSSSLAAITVPQTGSMCFEPSLADQDAGEVEFLLTLEYASDPTAQMSEILQVGANDTGSADLTINPPVTAGGPSTVDWVVAGYPNSSVLLNGEVKSSTGSVEAVSGTTYILQVVEANGCSTDEGGTTVAIEEKRKTAP